MAVEVLGVEVADFSRAKGYDAMKRLHTQFGDRIELLFANNDDMATGAIDYLLNAGIFPRSAHNRNMPIVIVGVDGTAVGLEMIEKGYLYGTVLNDSDRQADAIVTLIGYLLDGKDMTGFPYKIVNNHFIYIDGDIITLENLAGFQ